MANQGVGGLSEPLTEKPLYTGDKEHYVRDMFAAIAPQYDRLNAILELQSAQGVAAQDGPVSGRPSG